MLAQHALRVAEGALGLIGEGSRIVTISNSSTVQHALIHAQRAGRRLEVICAKSRPSLEGREQAALLMNCGLSVTLLEDAAAIEAAAHADLVLVGADMLTNRGLINKIGTRPMAMVAREAGVPFYTLCGSEKFLPPGFRPHQQPDMSVEDIWSDAPDQRGQRVALLRFHAAGGARGDRYRAGYFAGGSSRSLACGNQAASGAGELCQWRDARTADGS